MSTPKVMYELPHVRYLYVIKEVFYYGSISSAAAKAHISQPAATQSLARIEQLLNVQLFERQPKGMVPTEVGIIFERRLTRILEHLRRGDSLARKKTIRSTNGKITSSFHKHCSPVQFRALLAITKTGSFKQAARELNVSQPGIHRAMRDLALLAGFSLFAQTRGGIELAPATEVFVRQLRLAVSEFQQAIFEINEFLGQATTRINLGSLPLSRVSILPSAINKLLSDVGASVQVNCVDARYPTLLKDLRFGDLDFIIGALRFPKPAYDVEQEELFIDNLAVVVSPNHPLASCKDLTIEDTLAFPWVAPPRATPSGTYLFEKLRIHEMPKTPVCTVSSSLILLRGLLSRGEYVSITSKRQIEVEEQLGQLVQLPIDLPDSERAIGLTFRTGWRPTNVQEKFLDIIRKTAKMKSDKYI